MSATTLRRFLPCDELQVHGNAQAHSKLADLLQIFGIAIALINPQGYCMHWVMRLHAATFQIAP